MSKTYPEQPLTIVPSHFKCQKNWPLPPSRLASMQVECAFYNRNVIRCPGGSVKRLTLDFGSGHDLEVCEIRPRLGSALTVQSLLGILSHVLPLPTPK